MKKILLFFLVLLASMVFAYPACNQLSGMPSPSGLSITSPADDFTLYENQSFIFEAKAVSNVFSSGPCTVTVTFEYDERTGGASFVRIKDPSPFDPGTDYLESIADNTVQTGDITTVAGVTIPISVTCNTSGDYDLRLSSPSGGGVTSPVITIHCLAVANSPPTGQFLAPGFDTIIYKKDNAGAPEPFIYSVQWESNDAENDLLEYDIRILKDGSPFGSDSGLLAENYDLTINSFGEYSFEVDLKESSGGNSTTIYSETVFVKEQNFSTLSIEDLNVFPEALQGDQKIYVSVTVRNNSSDTVDINALFNFFDFPGGQYSFPACVSCAKANVAPFSKATLSIPVAGHVLSGIDSKDYNIHVVIQERLAGSPDIRNQIQSFGYFVVLQKTTPVSVPETNFISIMLVSLTVIFIARKKK